MTTRTVNKPRRLARTVGLTLMLCLAALCAQAEEAGSDSVQAIRSELERLKAEQAARATEMQKLEERLTALESVAAPAAATPAKTPKPVAVAKNAEPPSRLAVSGGFRLAYERNTRHD